MIFGLVTLTFQVVLLKKNFSWTTTFESVGLLIVAIYIWLPPASYVVFLTTLVLITNDIYLPLVSVFLTIKAKEH